MKITLLNNFYKYIIQMIQTLFTYRFVLSICICMLMFNSVFAQDGVALVQCGWLNACTISDLMKTASLFAEFILKIIFPALFFVGGLMSIFPLTKDPNNPENRAESKRRFKILLTGTVFILGAYIIIASILAFMGVKTDIIEKAVGDKTTYNIIDNTVALNIFDTAYAGIQNPLSNVSVQKILSTIANGVVFIAMIIGGYCVVRGGFMLVMIYINPSGSYQNTANGGNGGGDSLQRAKWWLIAGLMIWGIFFGAEYIIDILYNTLKDFPGASS